MTPTSRTLNWCRKQGWIAGVVEHWIPRLRIRRDLFGVFDVIAAGPGLIYGIQTTSGSNVSKRLDKIAGTPEAKVWIESGGAILVHGWRRPTKTRRKWSLRIVEASVQDGIIVFTERSTE